MIKQMKKSKRLFAIAAVFLLAGCGDAEGGVEAALSQNALISDCGGFSDNTSALKVSATLKAADYCDAEVLDWQYDSASETLTITNARILLNCCGEHDMTIEQLDDGTYLITEIDEPENLGNGNTDRCLCSCVYDFEIQAQTIPNESISVRIVRDIAEEAELIEVWEGTLNLPEEPEGSVIINEDDVSAWCDETK